MTLVDNVIGVLRDQFPDASVERVFPVKSPDEKPYLVIIQHPTGGNYGFFVGDDFDMDEVHDYIQRKR